MSKSVRMAHRWQGATPSIQSAHYQPRTCMLLLTVRRKSAGNAAAARGLGLGTPNIFRTLAQYSSCPLTVLSTPTTCISITLHMSIEDMLDRKCRRLSKATACSRMYTFWCTGWPHLDLKIVSCGQSLLDKDAQGFSLVIICQVCLHVSRLERPVLTMLRQFPSLTIAEEPPLVSSWGAGHV